MATQKLLSFDQYPLFQLSKYCNTVYVSIMGYYSLCGKQRQHDQARERLKSKYVFATAVCLAIHLRQHGTLLFRREIKLQSNIDCSFMISHLLDQSNPSSVINFATIFVIQHHKMGTVWFQRGCMPPFLFTITLHILYYKYFWLRNWILEKEN